MTKPGKYDCMVPLHLIPVTIAQRIRQRGGNLYRISVVRTHEHCYTIKCKCRVKIAMEPLAYYPDHPVNDRPEPLSLPHAGNPEPEPVSDISRGNPVVLILSGPSNGNPGGISSVNPGPLSDTTSGNPGPEPVSNTAWGNPGPGLISGQHSTAGDDA
jgi:hypothetical protein